MNKRNPMPAVMKRFLVKEEGVALIETAYVVIFLTIMFFGLAEIASLIKIRERMARTAGDVAAALSTMPVWNNGGGTGAILGSAGLITAPYGARISVRFCDLGVGGFPGSSAATTTQGLKGPGDCSLGPKSSGGAGGGASCGSSAAQQYVVVSAGCSYSPMISVLGFFRENSISAVAVAPMRNTMKWYIPVPMAGGG